MIEATIKPVEILLVEDNPGDVFLTKNAFSETKIKNNISVAKDGEEAMDYLHKRNGFENAITPDLLLLDINMPKKDGREVLEEIKADEVLRHIPVVIMTSSKAEKDVIKTYDLHANSYIIKPVDLKQFSEAVNAIENFWFSIVTPLKQSEE
jgi:chemotaxis family two-component system response regulator Rcp1